MNRAPVTRTSEPSYARIWHPSSRVAFRAQRSRTRLTEQGRVHRSSRSVSPSESGVLRHRSEPHELFRKTRLPHSAQYRPRLSSGESHTGHRRANTANTARPGSRIKSATTTAIAVPVTYSARRYSAKGIRPSPCSHPTIVPTFANTSTAAMTPTTTSLRLPIDITHLASSFLSL